MSWACGIVYALGHANFLSDPSSTPCMELCARFGVSSSTGAAKAKAVRDALGIAAWDHRWLLPANLASLPTAWMVEVDGVVVDARRQPRPFQVAAYEQGAIPWVPADGPDGSEGLRDAILARYDRCRAVNTMQQSLLAKRLWTASVAPVAVRLGLVESEGEAVAFDLDELPTAADLALYAKDRDGVSPVSRHAAEGRERLTEQERQVLDAMCTARFSIFRVEGGHRGAGVDVSDLLSGDRVWVVDRRLEARAPAGMELAMRLFQPEDFWMGTGAVVAMNQGIWQELEKAGLIQRAPAAARALRPDVLAEAIYRLAGR